MNDTITTISLVQQQDYRFQIEFAPPVAPIVGDEPPPLGGAAGPSPVELLASAVGNCLADSLLFALRKFKQNPEPMKAQVHATVGRNEQGRLRVLRMQADLHLGVPAAQLEHLQRVLDTFDQYCTVTQSVNGTMAVSVSVFDSTGARLK